MIFLQSIGSSEQASRGSSKDIPRRGHGLDGLEKSCFCRNDEGESGVDIAD